MIALVPPIGTKNPILGVLALGLFIEGQFCHRAKLTHVQYNCTDSVRNFDLRSVRTVKEVTDRKHFSYSPDVSVSSPGLHVIRTGHPAAERPGLNLIRTEHPAAER